jgi:hypothetical protein
MPVCVASVTATATFRPHFQPRFSTKFSLASARPPSCDECAVNNFLVWRSKIFCQRVTHWVCKSCAVPSNRAGFAQPDPAVHWEISLFEAGTLLALEP